MLLLEMKTNTQCVHAGTSVSRQDGNLGNRDAQGVEVCGAPVPRFYKPGGCWVLLSSGGQYSARCTWSGRESGDDRNEKETWTWQPRGAQGKKGRLLYGRERERQ